MTAADRARLLKRRGRLLSRLAWAIDSRDRAAARVDELTAELTAELAALEARKAEAER